MPKSDAKKFLWNFFRFSWPLLVLFLALDYTVVCTPNSYTLKRGLLEHFRASAEIVVLGSSHTMYGIDPAAFARPAVNLANASQSLEIDAELFQRCADTFPRLKLAIVPFSYPSLAGRLSNTDELWRNFLYFRFLGIRGEQRPMDLLNLRNWFPTLALGRDAIVRLLFERNRSGLRAPIGPLGWLAFPVRAGQKSPSDGPERVRVHESAMREESIAINLAVIKKMLEVADRKKIKIVFVTLPVASSYATAMNARLWSEFQSQLRSALHPYGAAYYDYLQEPRFVPSDFANSDHLNQQGAEKVSQILDTEVVEPVLRDSTGRLAERFEKRRRPSFPYW